MEGSGDPSNKVGFYLIVLLGRNGGGWSQARKKERMVRASLGRTTKGDSEETGRMTPGEISPRSIDVDGAVAIIYRDRDRPNLTGEPLLVQFKGRSLQKKTDNYQKKRKS